MKRFKTIFMNRFYFIACLCIYIYEYVQEPIRDPQFAAFVPSLHAQSLSGNSLTFISSQIPAAVKL